LRSIPESGNPCCHESKRGAMEGNSERGSEIELQPDAETGALFNPDEFGAEVAEDAQDNVFARLRVAEVYGAGAPLKLKRIRARNILGFEDTEVHLGDFNVLVGINNSGKSSLMRLISFAQTLLRLHFERVQGDEVVLARGRNIDDNLLPVPQVRDLWFRGVRRVGNVWTMAELELEFDSGLVVGFGLKPPFGHATSRLTGDNVRLPRADFERLATYPIVYVPSSVGVVDREEYRTPARIGALIAGGRAHEVLRNLLLHLNAAGLEDVGRVLREYFGGVVSEVTFDEDSDQFISVTYEEDSQHELFSAGAGFLQVLQLVTFVVHERPGILLVDEPDAHLHSSLQRLVVDVLRRWSADAGFQVLLATHSKEIVNYVDADELLVVDRRQSVLRGLGEHETAISVLNSLGAVDSVDAYQVVSTQKVVLVEGATDPKVLATIAAKRESHVFEGSGRIVVIETGGESTPAARSDLNIVERILDRPLRSLQIRDHDARIDEHVRATEEGAPRPLHVWRRDSIESYLVVPSALARLIAQKVGVDVADVEERVRHFVADAVDELRDDTLDRAATRFRHEVIQFEARNVEPAEANRTVREAMQDDEIVIRLTRGKDLLAGVRTRISDAYRVSFGNIAILKEMTDEEVDPEVWAVLDRIEALAAE
jgi:predicted ATPase